MRGAAHFLPDGLAFYRKGPGCGNPELAALTEDEEDP